MLFINDTVQNTNVDLDQIFTIDDLQLFLMLYADEAVVFATTIYFIQHRIKVYALGAKDKHCNNEGHDIEKGSHTHFDFYLNNLN